MMSPSATSIRETSSTQKRNGVSLTILLTYFGIRFGLDRQLDRLGELASYLFEVCFILAVGFYYWKRLNFSMPRASRVFIDGILGLATGFLIYKLAKPLSLSIPFQLQEKYTIALLLIVAPLIEEGLFRMALLEPLADLLRAPWLVILSTSIIFSFAHFFAWWSVPAQFHPFVLYQSLYVLPLAFYCAYRRYETGSVLIAIVIHFGFNLGFYLGFIA